MKKGIVLVCVLLVSFIGCFDSDNTSTSSKASRVITASAEQIERINFGMKEGYTLSNIKTIKSKDFDNVYFVGGIIKRERSGSLNVGIWATGGKANISMSYSVNSNAINSSDYPDGKKTQAGITMYDDGISELVKYLEAILK